MSSEPVVLRLPYRPPLHAAGIFGFLGRRAVPGLESWDGSTYRRALDLTHGDGVLTVHVPTGANRAAGVAGTERAAGTGGATGVAGADRAGRAAGADRADGVAGADGSAGAGRAGGPDGLGGPLGAGAVATAGPDGPGSWLDAELLLADRRDHDEAVRAARRLFDLDVDPRAVDAVLGADPLLAPLVARRPGVRVPGAVGGLELLVRAVLGQQISVAGARTLAGRLVARFGEPLELDLGPLAGPAAAAGGPGGSPTHRFPTAAALAAADPETLQLPRARARALVAACRAVAEGTLDLAVDDRVAGGATDDPPRAGVRAGVGAGGDGDGGGRTREGLRRQLLALPGIGPWTADYLLLRAFGGRDVFLAGDLGVRHALERLGVDARPGPAAARAERWSPWRAHAVLHLWLSLEE